MEKKYTQGMVDFKLGDKIIMFDADEYMKLPKEQRNPSKYPDLWNTYYKECTVTRIYQDDESEWKCNVVFDTRISLGHYCNCAKPI